jgi:hypothetical protein
LVVPGPDAERNQTRRRKFQIFRRQCCYVSELCFAVLLFACGKNSWDPDLLANL